MISLSLFVKLVIIVSVVVSITDMVAFYHIKKNPERLSARATRTTNFNLSSRDNSGFMYYGCSCLSSVWQFV